MKKLSFRSPKNRKSKIDTKIEKLNTNEREIEYLESEQPDSEQVSPKNPQRKHQVKYNSQQPSFLKDETDQSLTVYDARLSTGN